MKKRLLLGSLILLAIVAAAGLWFWDQMQQPLYHPGDVRAGRDLRGPLTPPPQLASGDFWNVETDIRLYHWSVGNGTNVLVIHGGPGEPFTQPLPGLAPLTARYRFVYYDQRGAGASSRPLDRWTSSNYWENVQTLDRTLGLGAQVADIERIRQILGQDRLVLIGHSFGGFLAALYAAEFPERVQALVLLAPADLLVMPPADGGLFEQLKSHLPLEKRAEYDAFLKRYLDYGSLFSKSEADLAAQNAEFAAYYELAASDLGWRLPTRPASALGAGWGVQAMYLSMGLQHDYRSALSAVRAPVLVVHGAADIQPEAASRAYAQVLPNAEFRVIPGAGHFAFEDRPEEFVHLVGEFLDNHNSTEVSK